MVKDKRLILLSKNCVKKTVDQSFKEFSDWCIVFYMYFYPEW